MSEQVIGKEKVISNNTSRLKEFFVKNVGVSFVDGKAQTKRYKDERGLFLVVTARGSKLWRYAYSFKNKKYTYAIGKYPMISLKKAREIINELEALRAKGINPTEHKQDLKIKEKEVDNDTFFNVSQEWLKLQKGRLAETTLHKHVQALEKNFYPFISNKPMCMITKKEMINIAQKVQDRGALETAHRLLNLCNQIWRYALNLDKVEHNIIAEISKKDVLKPFSAKNFRTIVDKDRIGELLRAIDLYRGEYTTRALLKLLPFVFARSANIRAMEWQEIDFIGKCWTISADKMKTKKEHKIPLSNEAIAIIREIEPYTKDTLYVFCSPLNRFKMLSGNTINKALKQMGFHDEIVAHGFRAMFSTISYESGLFRGEVIESLLAHTDENKVRASYNRASYENEKREVIEWWSNYLVEAKRLDNNGLNK